MISNLELIFTDGGWGIRHIPTGEVIATDPNHRRATDLLVYLNDLTDIDFNTDSQNKLHARIERWWNCGL